MKKIILILALLLTACAAEETVTPPKPEIELPEEPIIEEVPEPEYKFSGYTEKYPHGVMGSISLPTIISYNKNSYDVSPDVIEGSIIRGDINDDNFSEFILTVSNEDKGARIVILNKDLELIAESEPIGTGFRWRHTIEVNDFGQGTELVSVRTPHIGGIVEFFKLEDGKLIITAEQEGYTSHDFGSTESLATTGDKNNDNITELIIPTQNKRYIAGLQRTEDGIKEVYRE